MAESVEVATILLTDLVGSTRPATPVAPARTDQLRKRALRRGSCVRGGRAEELAMPCEPCIAQAAREAHVPIPDRYARSCAPWALFCDPNGNGWLPLKGLDRVVPSPT